MSYSFVHEPSCIHNQHQPASMCTECRQMPSLQEWRDYWTEERRMEWLRWNHVFQWAAIMNGHKRSPMTTNV